PSGEATRRPSQRQTGISLSAIAIAGRLPRTSRLYAPLPRRRSNRQAPPTVLLLTSPERRRRMGIGVSLILIAVGAVLAWAIHTTNSHGFDINTIGYIVLAVGVAGLLISMMFWSTWAGPGYCRSRRR